MQFPHPRINAPILPSVPPITLTPPPANIIKFTPRPHTAGSSREPIFRRWVIAAREHPNIPQGFIEYLAGFLPSPCDADILKSHKVVEFVRVFEEIEESEKTA